MTSGRRTTLADFVREIANAPRPERKSPKGPDFVYCRPTTKTIEQADHPRPRPPADFDIDDAEAPAAPEATLITPIDEVEGTSDTDDLDALAGVGKTQRMRLVAGAGAAALAALIAVVFLVVAGGEDPPIEPRDVARAQPAILVRDTPTAAPRDAPAAQNPRPSTPPPSDKTPQATKPAESAKATAAPGRTHHKKPARAKPKPRSFRANGPSYVRWLLPSGRRVGSGSGKFSVPASTRSIIAFNTKTRAKSTVPLRSTVDYAALPKGKLDVRAYPYADVYAGSVKLGTTPFSPLRLPVGTYDLKLKYQGQTQRRRVQIKAQKATRVKVRVQ